MHKELVDILSANPGLKAREIARRLSQDSSIKRKDVNSHLYKNADKFRKDEDDRWYLVNADTHKLELDQSTWVDVDSFEKSLTDSGCLLSSSSSQHVITLPFGCKPLLESIARLLSLSNQLHHLGKNIVVDLNECKGTKSYLNRMGFFDLLHKDVLVKPSRPARSTAKIYRANCDSVVELGEINPASPQTSIPKMLKNAFVAEAGIEYGDAVFTFFSELFDNVCEHSETVIPGFAALQVYGKKGTGRRHIQVVVSDSGKGITTTLKPVLKEHYAHIFNKLDFDDPNSDLALLKEVLLRGRITRMGDPKKTGRGLGLKRSADYAPLYNANISVRQETFELRLLYKHGKLCKTLGRTGMPKILGTHICFDFFLD